MQNAAQHVGFAEAFATAGGLKRLRKLLDSSHSVVVRFASGANPNPNPKPKPKPKPKPNPNPNPNPNARCASPQER